MSVIFLTVQSKYNSSFEKTTLQFKVCDISAGGCETNLYSTTATTKQSIYSVKPDYTITIIIGWSTGVIAIVMIVVGVFCWKQQQNRRSSNKESNLLL